MLNTNNTLLAGGRYNGGSEWNKKASVLDQCFKLYWIKSGTAIIVSEGTEYELISGNVYFINGFKIEYQNCPDTFEVYWLHFSCDSLMLKRLLQGLTVVIPVSNDILEYFHPVFKSLIKYFNETVVFKNTQIRSYISESIMIQSLINSVIGNVIKKSEYDRFRPERIESRLVPALEYINSYYKKEITLKKLAELCFISENYFHTLFKKAFKVTPNNYILQLRMTEALNLLTNTNIPVKEIARETGFYDTAYFSKTFSKYYEMSPREYRNSLLSRVP